MGGILFTQCILSYDSPKFTHIIHEKYNYPISTSPKVLTHSLINSQSKISLNIISSKRSILHTNIFLGAPTNVQEKSNRTIHARLQNHRIQHTHFSVLLSISSLPSLSVLTCSGILRKPHLPQDNYYPETVTVNGNGLKPLRVC